MRGPCRGAQPLVPEYQQQAAAGREEVKEAFHSAGDRGVSTLEMVIITLGLIAVATLLVTAITLAVTRRTDQIK